MRDLVNPAYLLRKRGRIAPYLGGKARRMRLRAAARGLPFTAWRADLEARRRRLAALRGAHAGRRCFVIGNGPSLAPADLTRLRGEVTIASNKIYLAFEQTEWRPSYYTVSDLMVAEANREAIDALPLTKIVDLEMRTIFDDSEDYLYFNAGRAGYSELAPYRFSDAFERVAYGGYSVTYLNLQLAWHLGCREVYLLGVDFHFTLPPGGEAAYDPNFAYRIEHRGEQNHFDPRYRAPGEAWSWPRLDLQRGAFLAARDFFAARGGRIANASRRSELDVFPKISLEEVLA